MSAQVQEAQRPGVAPFFIAAAAAFATASVGGALTDLGPWYDALRKPAWQPPGWAFPVAWTAIFTLTAIAAALCWRASETQSQRRSTVVLFGLNAVLNVAWSGLFFTLQRPDWSLVEVAFLWASILSLIIFARRRNGLAALLLAPYLIWVSIAAFLNYEIVALNAPF